MKSVVVSICIIVLFSIAWSIVLYGLNKSMLQLFVPIQKLTSKLKRKRLISNLCLLFSIAICVSLKEYYNLSDIINGIVIGFFLSLNDIIFEREVRKA